MRSKGTVSRECRDAAALPTDPQAPDQLRSACHRHASPTTRAPPALLPPLANTNSRSIAAGDSQTARFSLKRVGIQTTAATLARAAAVAENSLGDLLLQRTNVLHQVADLGVTETLCLKARHLALAVGDDSGQIGVRHTLHVCATQRL